MKYLLTTFAFLFLVGAIQYAAAQELGGGVDKEGSWYVGEGLKTGDRFEYSVCYVDYKECKPLVMDFWIKGDIAEGSLKTKYRRIFCVCMQAVLKQSYMINQRSMHLGPKGFTCGPPSPYIQLLHEMSLNAFGPSPPSPP